MLDIEGRLRAIAEVAAQDEQKARQTEIDRQVRDGKANLIPFPRVQSRPFRSELTLERHAIFIANSFKGDSWQFERKLTHPTTGEPVIQKVMVGKVSDTDRPRGVLRQIHQEVFYHLLRMWDEQGYPLSEVQGGHYGVVTTTAYELVNRIRGSDSESDYKRVRALLQDLASIPIVIDHAYAWRDGLKDLNQFTLLGLLEWSERKYEGARAKGGRRSSSKVRIMLSRMVTDGFLGKSVKQLLLGPYEELGVGPRGRRGEIARLLYPILDHELYDKEYYHCRLSALAERLGLARHSKKALRRQQFESAVRLLNGKPILGEEYTLNVSLQLSRREDDYILVARKRDAPKRQRH